jgi:DNA-binding NarL/FixJ family response regulator
MPRILVADDHGLYRKGLRSTLEAALPNLDICEADSLDAALIVIEAAGNLDLVLIDLNMPGVISFESLREARECYPKIRFLVISASDAKDDILACLATGLHGFVSKLQPDDEIVAAIKHVLSGCIYVPPWLAQVGVFGPDRSFGTGLQPYLKIQDPFAKLTPRQRDVLPLLARGMSNKEIARTLKIAEATTKIHAAALCRVLGARNRTEAAVVARDLLNQSARKTERQTSPPRQLDAPLFSLQPATET